MLALRRPGAACPRAQDDDRAFHGTGAFDFRDPGLPAGRAAARAGGARRRARNGRRPDARRKLQHRAVRPFFSQRLRRGGQGASPVAGRGSCARRRTGPEERGKAPKGKEMNEFVSLRGWMAVAAAALLSGCAVGPDYRTPDSPAVDLYTEKPQPEQPETAGVRGVEAQRFEVGAKISSERWTLLGSSEIDELMRSALSFHPTLDAAQTSLRQAEEDLN